MMFIAFGMNAQNTTERGTTRERKPATTETKKAARTETRSTTKPARTDNKAVRPSSNVNRPDRSSSQTTQPAAAPSRENSRPASRPATAPNASDNRSRSTVTPSNREVSQPSRTNGNTRVNRSTPVTHDNGAPSRGNSYNRPPRTTSGHTAVNHSSAKITYDPKRGETYTEQRRVYTTPAPRRVVRTTPHVNYVERPIEYRRSHNPYRVPPTINIIWNEPMYRQYSVWYPEFHYWYYPFGYTIHTISSYDAAGYIGEVTRVYGMVSETWYSPESDEYFLYFGGPYPYQDFSVVLEGRDARRFSRRPERFFTNRYIAVTGLVSLWQDKPEIDVKRRSQVEIY